MGYVSSDYITVVIIQMICSMLYLKKKNKRKESMISDVWPVPASDVKISLF